MYGSSRDVELFTEKTINPYPINGIMNEVRVISEEGSKGEEFL